MGKKNFLSLCKACREGERQIVRLLRLWLPLTFEVLLQHDTTHILNCIAEMNVEQVVFFPHDQQLNNMPQPPSPMWSRAQNEFCILIPSLIWKWPKRSSYDYGKPDRHQLGPEASRNEKKSHVATCTARRFHPSIMPQRGRRSLSLSLTLGWLKLLLSLKLKLIFSFSDFGSKRQGLGSKVS